jgi:hypothetical protein
MTNSSVPSVGDHTCKTTIVAEMVTGSHVLEVKGYSISKGQLGVGKRIDPGVFSVAGHKGILEYTRMASTRRAPITSLSLCTSKILSLRPM